MSEWVIILSFTIFLLFSILSFFIGWIYGWKKVLYFGGFNLLLFIIFLLVYKLANTSLINTTKNILLSNFVQARIDQIMRLFGANKEYFDTYFDAFVLVFQNYVIFFIYLICFILVNVFLLIFSFFIGKIFPKLNLKKSKNLKFKNVFLKVTTNKSKVIGKYFSLNFLTGLLHFVLSLPIILGFNGYINSSIHLAVNIVDQTSDNKFSNKIETNPHFMNFAKGIQPASIGYYNFVQNHLQNFSLSGDLTLSSERIFAILNVYQNRDNISTLFKNNYEQLNKLFQINTTITSTQTTNAKTLNFNKSAFVLQNFSFMNSIGTIDTADTSKIINMISSEESISDEQLSSLYDFLKQNKGEIDLNNINSVEDLLKNPVIAKQLTKQNPNLKSAVENLNASNNKTESQKYYSWIELIFRGYSLNDLKMLDKVLNSFNLESAIKPVYQSIKQYSSNSIELATQQIWALVNYNQDNIRFLHEKTLKISKELHQYLLNYLTNLALKVFNEETSEPNQSQSMTTTKTNKKFTYQEIEQLVDALLHVLSYHN